MANNETLVRRDFWTKIKRYARQVPFAEDAVAAYYCALDPKTPARVKGVLLAALAYFILPVDAIPDFILGLGFTDDATVLLTAIMMVKSHVTDDHRRRARLVLSDIDEDEDGKIIEGEIVA